MKSDTAKAFNKRRFREKEVEKFLIKHKQIILVDEEKAEIKI